MRHTLPIALVLTGLAATAPAFAQSPAATNPAAPSSSQAAPQSSNSLPPGAGVQSEPTIGGTAAPNNGTSNLETATHPRTVRHHRRVRHHATSSVSQ